MAKPKTHFELVPLEIVKNIAEIEPQDATEETRKIKKNGDSTSTPSVDRRGNVNKRALSR